MAKPQFPSKDWDDRERRFDAIDQDRYERRHASLPDETGEDAKNVTKLVREAIESWMEYQKKYKKDHGQA